MKIARNMLSGLLLFWFVLMPASAATPWNYPERQTVGTIQDVELSESNLIVDGMRYGVAIDAHVEINGSYGAFTMLKTGMKIDFTYKVISESERLIVRIREIPSEYRIEGV